MQNNCMNILLIEDEQRIADFIVTGFESAGFVVHHEIDGFRGLNTALIKNFDAVVLDVALPDAGFYLWARVQGDDAAFARELHALYNVTVLPGSYLARDAQGSNPGQGRIRMALVAETAEGQARQFITQMGWRDANDEQVRLVFRLQQL